MTEKESEFGLPSGRRAGGVTPHIKRAAAGGHSGLSSADQLRDVYALDSLRDDEDVNEVEIGRQTGDVDGRRAPFGG
jgi:hypothetical protein